MNPSVQLGVGETLRARRRQKNLTVEFVSQETRIQQRFIKALEDERWDEFPARVYLEGFLRKYAGVLGLEADELVARLRQNVAQPEKPPSIQQPTPKDAEADIAAQGSPAAVFVLLGLLVLGGLYIYSNRASSPAPSAPERHEAAAAAPVMPSAVSIPGMPAKHEFQVRARSGVWVRAWVDGQPRFEGIVPAGMAKTWTGESGFRVVVAETSRAEVFVDGQKLESPAAAGSADFKWPPPAAPAPPPPAAP